MIHRATSLWKEQRPMQSKKAGNIVHISSLSEVAGKYEAVLLDQFGVLHDGRKAYSQRTVEAVQLLAASGIQVCLICSSVN